MALYEYIFICFSIKRLIWLWGGTIANQFVYAHPRYTTNELADIKLRFPLDRVRNQKSLETLYIIYISLNSNTQIKNGI